MPSSYPAAPDDLTAGNTSLDHGDVSDAVAAVQATLGVNPQGAEATVAARLAAGPTFGVNLDIPDQAPNSPEPPAAGYTRLVAYTSEGNDLPPILMVINSEGFDAEILSAEQATASFLSINILAASVPGAFLVRGPDGYLVEFLPGTDGQVLTADSSNPLGVVWADPA